MFDSETEKLLSLIRKLNDKENLHIIIETGYFEVRDKDAPDRFEHATDSLNIYLQLKSKSNNVSLCVFVNNYCPETTFCGFSGNHVKNSFSERNIQDDWDYVPQRAIDIYRKTLGEENINRKIELFKIKTTRNRAAKSIKYKLKEKHDFFVEKIDGDEIDILFDTGYEQYPLASKRLNSNSLSIRCPALMAQHYYDIITRFQIKNPECQPTTTVIIDSSRWTEKQSVLAGVEITRDMCNWKSLGKVIIANFVYFDDIHGIKLYVNELD